MTYGADAVVHAVTSRRLYIQQSNKIQLESASTMIRTVVTILALTLITTGICATKKWNYIHSVDDEYKSGIKWPEPPVVDPGDSTKAPSDAIVLFDGTDMFAWDGGDDWEMKDGYVITRKRGISTKQKFGDCQLHIEFATPEEVKGSGQGRGNSGVYLMGRYEVQVLDSFENETYFDGQCGAIYKQQPPTVNACRAPGQWQSYDIIFTAPNFSADGQVETPAYVTVLQNGVVIHNHFELMGGTYYDKPPSYSSHPDKLPISLQFHGNPIKFRNIWVRENIQPIVGEKPPAE
jgi:hypothetical protein